MNAKLPIAWAFAAALAAGCDTLECGEGTHRDGDRCVTNDPITCGEGTEFRDGHCVAVGGGETDAGPERDAGDPLTCGPGTHREGNQCVPDDGPGPRRDAGPDRDLGPDTDADVGPETDAEPDMGPPMPQGCPADRLPAPIPQGCPAMPGTYCVVGQAVEFLTGCKLPADEGLFVAVIDPAAAAGGAPFEEYVRGTGAISADGTFAINARGDSLQLAIVIDENPAAGVPDRWTRSVSGVLPTPPTAGRTYPVRAFATTLETQAVWNDALGLGERALEQGGFLVGRVFRPGDSPSGLAPAAGARVRARNDADLLDCATAPFCLRFFDDDPRLTGFMPEGHGATEDSGAYLIRLVGGVPVRQDVFFIEGQAGTYADVPGGASAGSGFHTGFVPSAN